MASISNLLKKIYGEKKGDEARRLVSPLIESFSPLEKKRREMFDQTDAFLITYGDSLLREDRRPLETLREFALRRFKGYFDTIHILPFFPYSSDDGFSVMDFTAVNPDLGEWSDIDEIGRDFKLAFDFVLNHVSARGDWFRKYLAEKEGFRDLAIEVDPAMDLSMVARPRALPLLTEFEKKSGEKAHVWTTFGADQIDLNYKSPEVLGKMLSVLLFYLKQGASALRMDAVAYLWKEPGTSCIHLEQTHDAVRLFRAIIEKVAPGTAILTETNVPHDENTSYFGDGTDEAHMVYNFTLPPLLLHAFVNGDARLLSEWAAGLRTPSENCAFFNFTASHDGIGVRPLEGIVSASEIARLCDRVEKNGGMVSYKTNPDGSRSPYELNIVYFDALRTPDGTDADRALDVRRFLASQAVQYALPGVPATYVHSVLGSRNWTAGVEKTGMPRSVNREKLDAEKVEKELENPDGFRSRVFHPYLEMIGVRRRQPAFHPNADFRVLDADPRVFAFERKGGSQTLLAIANVSSERVEVRLSGVGENDKMVDLFTNKETALKTLELEPCQFVWLSDEFH